eukprot:9666745-Lingulodinium_polyedra.AAC.1
MKNYLMYKPGRKRWLTATESLAGHGWPEIATMVHASRGAFSPEQTPPETPTYRTVRRQVGNSKFPTLGKTRNMV